MRITGSWVIIPSTFQEDWKIDNLTYDMPSYSTILPDFLINGCRISSNTGNLIPEELAQLSRLRQKYKNVMNFQVSAFRYFPLMEICYSVTNPVVIKAGLNILGLPGGNPRLPLRPLGDEKFKQLKEIMDKLGVIKKYKV